MNAPRRAVLFACSALAALWFALRLVTRPSPEPAGSTPGRGSLSTMPAPVAVQPDVRGKASPVASAQTKPASSKSLADQIILALQTGNDADREWVLVELLPSLVKRDALTAARLAENWTPGATRDELLRQVARLWSAADIAGAVAWLAALDNRVDQTIAVESAVRQIYRTDPAGAAEVSQYFRVGLDNGTLEHLVQIWTEESPAEAVNWIVARPAGPERDRLLARIAWVRAQSDPSEAVALVLNLMPPGATRDDALAAVAKQWALRDPAAANAWAGQLPAGALRTRSLAAIDAGHKPH
jgi:hypothetical protein